MDDAAEQQGNRTGQVVNVNKYKGLNKYKSLKSHNTGEWGYNKPFPYKRTRRLETENKKKKKSTVIDRCTKGFGTCILLQCRLNTLI